MVNFRGSEMQTSALEYGLKIKCLTLQQVSSKPYYKSFQEVSGDHNL